MKRYLVHLPERQIKELGELSKKMDIPKAEIIRRAIDEFLSKKSDEKDN